MEKRHLLRQNMIAIVGLILSAYFAYHLMAGERSYLRLFSLERQISQIEQEYNTVSLEKSALEKKVVMMRPGSIDRDLLEERVREVLGYQGQDENILLYAN